LQLKKLILSKFIYILPANESFFFKVKFEKKVKLTDELIALNYKKHAPYKNPNFKTLTENQNLYIWFYEQEINSKLIIPESYLLFNFFKEKYANALLNIDLGNSHCILIIKNSLLVNSYTMLEDDKNIVDMERNRFGIEQYIKIDKSRYIEIKREAVESLSLQDLYKWTDINVQKEGLFANIVNKIAYPLALLLFFTMAVEQYHVREVKANLAKVEEAYTLAKSKNDDIREKINSEEKKEEKWLNFVHKELPYEDSLTIFTHISKAFNEKKFTFESFTIVGSKLKITIKTQEDFIEGLNVLNTIDVLKDVALKYTNKKRHVATYEATLLSKGLEL